jgi:hypothetical protein
MGMEMMEHIIGNVFDILKEIYLQLIELAVQQKRLDHLLIDDQ